MRVLVLALGNPILGDDGVAFHVLAALRSRLSEGPDLVLDEAMAGGIELLTHIVGFDRVLILDAVKTPGATPGQVRAFKEGDFEETLHASSPHSTNFATAMAMGRAMHPDEMPSEVAIVGVEVERVYEFNEGLTPAVEAAVPVAAEEAARVLRAWGVQVGRPPRRKPRGSLRDR